MVQFEGLRSAAMGKCRESLTALRELASTAFSSSMSTTHLSSTMCGSCTMDLATVQFQGFGARVQAVHLPRQRVKGCACGTVTGIGFVVLQTWVLSYSDVSSMEFKVWDLVSGTCQHHTTHDENPQSTKPLQASGEQGAGRRQKTRKLQLQEYHTSRLKAMVCILAPYSTVELLFSKYFPCIRQKQCNRKYQYD